MNAMNKYFVTSWHEKDSLPLARNRHHRSFKCVKLCVFCSLWIKLSSSIFRHAWLHSCISKCGNLQEYVITPIVCFHQTWRLCRHQSLVLCLHAILQRVNINVIELTLTTWMSCKAEYFWKKFCVWSLSCRLHNRHVLVTFFPFVWADKLHTNVCYPQLRKNASCIFYLVHLLAVVCKVNNKMKQLKREKAFAWALMNENEINMWLNIPFQ